MWVWVLNLSGWMIEKREIHTQHIFTSSTILMFTLTQTPTRSVHITYFKKRYLYQVLVSFPTFIKSLSPIYFDWHPLILFSYSIIFTKLKFSLAAVTVFHKGSEPVKDSSPRVDIPELWSFPWNLRDSISRHKTTISTKPASFVFRKPYVRVTLN